MYDELYLREVLSLSMPERSLSKAECSLSLCLC